MSDTSTGTLIAVPPVGDDLLGHLLGAFSVDIGHHHRGAVTGQRLGVGLADAATDPVTIATFSSNCPISILPLCRVSGL